MLIDRGHRNWAIGTAAAVVVASVVYYYYQAMTPGGPAGSTRFGMWFGVLGTAAMAFAGLLAVRKKLMRLRLGSVRWWLKGHIWISLLSVPLILFHAAFRVGGVLESLLWCLMAVVIITGLLGLAIQNILPRIMKVELPSEAIQDQWQFRCQALRSEADLLMREQSTELTSFYADVVRPYLAVAYDRTSQLHSAAQAEALFDEFHHVAPEAGRPVVRSLQDLCRQRRNLQLQDRLFFWLHGWLLVHVPTSYALFVFITLHVVTALYY